MDYLLAQLKTCDAPTLYYKLAAMKLLVEITGRLELTDEERKLLSSAMPGLQTRAAPQVTDKGKKKLHLNEIMDQLKPRKDS